MSKLWLAVAAAAFVFGSASGFAADTVKKKEELTTEQKSEIRDRVERMKADRAKAATSNTTPAAPAKKAEPKRTSKAMTPVIKTTPGTTGGTAKKAAAQV